MYNNIVYSADYGGCSFYRLRTQMMYIQNIDRQVNIIDTRNVISDPRQYSNINHVRLQRQVSTQAVGFIKDFLKPLSEKHGFWISYEVDDVISGNDIPNYNIGKKSYMTESNDNNITSILSMMDFVTVTTDELKDYTSSKFNCDFSKIMVIPNYLPKWWIDNKFDDNSVSKRWDSNKKKRRIGIVASSSHFDMNNQNGGIDDFTHILPFIIENRHKYEFVFVGGMPQQLIPYAKANEIKNARGFDILNYPNGVSNLNLDAIIAPLHDNAFNRCKSNIKLLENWALGIPVICQDLPIYSKFVGKDYLFNNSDDLKKRVEWLFADKHRYTTNVRKHYEILTKGNDLAPNGYWLESNIKMHHDMYRLPKKTIKMDWNDGKFINGD